MKRRGRKQARGAWRVARGADPKWSGGAHASRVLFRRLDENPPEGPRRDARAATRDALHGLCRTTRASRRCAPGVSTCPAPAATVCAVFR